MTNDDFPKGCEIQQFAESQYMLISFNGRYVVTKNTGQKKQVKGADAAAMKRARTFAWRFVEGYERDNYELEPA